MRREARRQEPLSGPGNAPVTTTDHRQPAGILPAGDSVRKGENNERLLRLLHLQQSPYVTAEGLNLTEQYDHYTHTTETRRKISSDSDSDSSSHSGGGSGSSGKY